MAGRHRRDRRRALPEQVDGWIDGGRLELSGADLEEIARAIDATGAGEGPARPGLKGAAGG